MRPSRRAELVETALDLFCREGFHATGIDRILADCGCAKMTLYNNFKSKEELILAALRLRDERFRNWFMRAVEKRAKTPRQRLLAVFDALAEWFRDASFNGCMFINASAEFKNADDPIHVAAAEHKRLLEAYLLDLAKAAGLKKPERVARQLMLLVSGATVMAHVTGDKAAARQAKEVAEALLASTA